MLEVLELDTHNFYVKYSRSFPYCYLHYKVSILSKGKKRKATSFKLKKAILIFIVSY